MENINNQGKDLFATDKLDVVGSDNVNDELIKWLTGLSKETPSDVKNKLDNAVCKINWLIACIIFSQAKQTIKMFEHLNKLSNKVFNDNELNTISTDKAYKNFLLLSNHLNDFLEFSRKFSLQNKELISESGDNDDLRRLLVLFKSLPKDKLTEIQSIIKEEV